MGYYKRLEIWGWRAEIWRAEIWRFGDLEIWRAEIDDRSFGVAPQTICPLCDI
jgi:hypothetical protein